MPLDKSRYPAEWKKFSLYIRYTRAKGKCELCGAEDKLPHPVTKSKVFLTVAHLDYYGGKCTCALDTGKKCADPAHVLALCQRCHLNMDRVHHVNKRKRNRLGGANPNQGVFW